MLKSAFTKGILSTSSGNGRCFTEYLNPTSFLGTGRGSGTKSCQNNTNDIIGITHHPTTTSDDVSSSHVPGLL